MKLSTNVSEMTGVEWPLSVYNKLPDAAFQIITVLSLEPLAIWPSLIANKTFTVLVCPISMLRSCPFSALLIIIFSSLEADAIFTLSIATRSFIGPVWLFIVKTLVPFSKLQYLTE